LNFTHFMRDLRRMMGDHDDVQYARGVEPQMKRYHRTGRMLLHDHLLIRCRGDLVAMKEAVRRLAIKHGFGHEIDLRWARPGDEGYIAKYVVDACTERPSVEWRDAKTGEVTRGSRARPMTKSARWGLTMKELKRQQIAWARQRAAERVAGVEARQGDAGHALPDAVEPGACGPLDSYTASYPDPGSALAEGRGW
jgi:hypothetical protein